MPATHQMDSEMAAVRPKVEPSSKASCPGPSASAANEAAAPSPIAQPLGFIHWMPAPPRKLFGLAMVTSRLGGPARPILSASHRR